MILLGLRNIVNTELFAVNEACVEVRVPALVDRHAEWSAWVEQDRSEEEGSEEEESTEEDDGSDEDGDYDENKGNDSDGSEENSVEEHSDGQRKCVLFKRTTALMPVKYEQ